MDSLVQQLTEHFTQCIQLTLRPKSRENVVRLFQVFFQISLLFSENETLLKDNRDAELSNFLQNIVAFMRREKTQMEELYVFFNKEKRFSPDEKQFIRLVAQNNLEKLNFFIKLI